MLEGFLVRGVSILKTKYDTLQAITYRPQWMVDIWYEKMLHEVADMIRCWETGVWDQNLDDACSSYGGCQFRKVCMTEPERQLVWLRQDFTKRRWDPVTRVETEMGEEE
jgi:hypothetical protein